MDGKLTDSAILPAFRLLREQARGVRWLMAFIVLPLAAYALYVHQEFGRLEDDSQEEIGHAAQVLEGTVKAALRSVNDIEDFKEESLKQFAVEQPYLEFAELTKGSAGPNEAAKARLVAGQDGLRIVRGSNNELAFGVSVNKLLQELSFLESFRTLALLDHDGHILLTADGQQPARLRQLRLAERELRETAFGDDPPLILVDLKGALNAGAVKPGFDEARSSASRLRAELAGNSYQIYIQPLRLHQTGTDKDHERQLLLVGLRPTTDVLRQSLAFDTYFLAILLLVIVGLCLSYPFLKLWALNHRERFRVSDLLLLYLSTGALLSVGATVVLAVDGYIRYQSLAAAILPELHKKLDGDFIAELRAARRQLVAADRCAPSLDLPAEPVQVEQVAWVGRDGRQVGKLTPNQHPGNPVSVAGRTYFRSVVNYGLWTLPALPGEPDLPPFYFGPRRSITDGQFYSFLSIPSAVRDCEANSTLTNSAVTVLTLSLHSLAPRPLPATFGFALFNREGTVLFHSDERLSLRQNFIHETEDSARLRASIVSGREDTLSLPYHGRPYRFLVRPVSGLRAAPGHSSGELYLAVFQDLSIVRYVATHAFLSSMLWPQAALGLWMAAGLAIASCVSRWRSPEGNWRHWLWTQPGRWSQYRRTVLILLGLLTIAISSQAAGISYTPSLLLPLVAPAVSMFFIIFSPPAAPSASARKTLAAVRWHRIHITVLAVCMSIVPVSALFQIIWGYELGKLAALEKRQSAALADDLPTQTRLRLIREKAPDDWVKQGAAVRLKYMEPGIGVRTQGLVTLSGPKWIYDWQDRASWALPMRNEVAISLRGLRADPFLPPRAPWGPIPRVIPVLTAILLFVWALYRWTGWNAHNVLLSGRQTAGASIDDPASAWAVLSVDEQCLLVQIGLERIANPRKSDMVISLVSRGWLVLAPEIRPASPAIQEFLLGPAQAACQTFENPAAIPTHEHSWRSVRKSLYIGVGVAVLFLISTQPALPMDFLGLISVVTAALGGAAKSMDRVNKWLTPPGKDSA